MNTHAVAAKCRPMTLDELWEAWKAAREQARLAYAGWCAAGSAGRRLAFAVFLAAHDQEAAAEAAYIARRPCTAT